MKKMIDSQRNKENKTYFLFLNFFFLSHLSALQCDTWLLFSLEFVAKGYGLLCRKKIIKK